MFFDVKSSHFSTHKMTSKKIRRIAFSVIDVSEEKDYRRLKNEE